MADDDTIPAEPEGEKPKTKRLLDLGSLLKPRATIEDSPLGRLDIRWITFAGQKELWKKEKEQTLTPESFLRELIRQVVRRPEDKEQALSDGDIDELLQIRGKLLPILIRTADFLHQSVWKDEKNADGQIVRKQAGKKRSIKREKGESAEEYLLRGWREDSENQRKTLADTFKNIFGVSNSLKALANPLGDLLKTGLLANSLASRQVGDRIAEMRKRDDELAKAIGGQTDPFSRGLVSPIDSYRDLPLHIPKNPIHDTNELLSELNAEIGEMRELAIQTAEMQRSLNDVATGILTQFTVGASASKSAATRTLIVAIISAAIALAAIFVSLGTNGPSSQELSLMQQQREAIQAESELLKANRRATDKLILQLQSLQKTAPATERKVDATKKTLPSKPTESSGKEPPA